MKAKISRRKTRRFIVQYLYASWAQSKEATWSDHMDSFEETPDFLDQKYFDEALGYIEKNLSYLLGVIKHFGPKFEVQQLPIVNLAILLVALYELIGATFDDIPERVSINEAIELAKRYSDPASKNFINGLLNSVLEKLSEIRAKKLEIAEIDWDIFHQHDEL